MFDNLTGRLHEAVAAVCPITGVSIGDRDVRETWRYMVASGATPAQIAAADGVLASFSAAVKTKRTLLAIITDLNALSTAKKNAIWTDITSGTPPKWSTDAGPNAAALAVLQLLGASATLSAADVLAAKIRGVAMYVQDNPTYLVNPAFDPTISISGVQ